MKFNKNTRKVILFVALVAIVFYVIRGTREKYEESVGPSVGPSAERSEEVEKIIKETNITQEDLDLMFEFIGD